MCVVAATVLACVSIAYSKVTLNHPLPIEQRIAISRYGNPAQPES